jgi:hypothetical protein
LKPVAQLYLWLILRFPWLSKRLAKATQAPEFGSRDSKLVFKNPFFPLNFDSEYSSLLTSINHQQQPVSTCLLAQFLLFLV